MASMTMTSSFLGGSASTIITRQLPTNTNNRHGLPASIRASTTKVADMEKIALNNKKEEESIKGRRGLVFGGVAAVAVAFSYSKIAMAADDDTTEEPKRGTPEAKKKYAPVCVTNPTARICRR